MSSATNKKNTKKQQPAAPVDIELNENMDPQEKDLCKKIRNGRKKMQQIQDLLKRSKDGEIVLNDEQKEKVTGKKALQEELTAQENQLVNYRETLVGEIKKAKELESKRQKELKQTREATVAQFADVLVLANLKQRGVDLGDAGTSTGVGALGDAFNALLTDGDSAKTKEKETFVKLFTSYANQSGAKVPGTETTYLTLNEAVPALIYSGKLPAKIPSAKGQEAATTATEEPVKPKKVKPSPAEFGHISKAVDNKVVAEADKKEETVAVAMDDDFLGVFDDDDEEDAQPAPKEEPKQAEETPAQEGEAAEGDANANKKKKWEDGENRGGGDRGRGDRGRGRGGRGRGRGGRGRGGNPNVDNEGFETVTDQPQRGGRGRGGRGRGGRGERGNRGDRGNRGRAETAPGQEQAGGKEVGTRGGRPQSSRINAAETKQDEPAKE